MRLEWCQDDKTIVNYRIESSMPKHGNHWRYHGQYKHFVDAQKYALGVASKLTEDYIIRIVKYTQNIEILETQKGNKDKEE